jgi:hypothetical protein
MFAQESHQVDQLDYGYGEHFGEYQIVDGLIQVVCFIFLVKCNRTSKALDNQECYGRVEATKEGHLYVQGRLTRSFGRVRFHSIDKFTNFGNQNVCLLQVGVSWQGTIVA